MTETSDKLAILSQIERRLATVETVDEAKGIRDKAEALRVYAKSAKAGLGIQNRAAAIKILAECKAGALLKAMEKAKGARTDKQPTYTKKAGLAAVGLSEVTAHRWQTMAPAAPQVLALEQAETKAGRELTSKGVYRMARKKAADLAPAPTPYDDIEIRKCDFRELLASLSDLDAIITDPPYSKEYVPLYAELAKAARAALSPEGVLAVMCGQSYLPEILPAMAAEMPYRWALAYLTPGGQAVQIWPRKINTFWKPILLFGADTDWLGDVVRSKVNDNNKAHHQWGQSESGMAELVSALTDAGELVCDPFAGGGTTGLICQRLGRRFIGGDLHVEV
jgi:16S rRNA G966 N2-methylase RsmD